MSFNDRAALPLAFLTTTRHSWPQTEPIESFGSNCLKSLLSHSQARGNFRHYVRQWWSWSWRWLTWWLLMMNKMMAIKMVVAMTLVMVMIKDELVLMIGLFDEHVLIQQFKSPKGCTFGSKQPPGATHYVRRPTPIAQTGLRLLSCYVHTSIQAERISTHLRGTFSDTGLIIIQRR